MGDGDNVPDVQNPGMLGADNPDQSAAFAGLRAQTAPPPPPPMAGPTDLSNAQSSMGVTQFPSSAPHPVVNAAQTARGMNEPMPAGSFGSRLYHGILQGLGGAHETVMTGIDPNTGSPIMSTRDLKPGEQWKNIIASALTGWAAGAGETGPGATGRAARAGYQAGQQIPLIRQQAERAQAQQTFENQQKAANDAANRAHLNSETAINGLTAKNMEMESTTKIQQAGTAFRKMLSESGKGTTDLGHFANMDEVMDHFEKDPSMHDQHAQGYIATMPHVGADGKISGIDAAWVTPDWLHSKTTYDMPITVEHLENGKWVEESQTIPAGGVTNEYALQFHQHQANNDIKQFRAMTDRDYKVQSMQVKRVLANATAGLDIARENELGAQAAYLQAKKDGLNDQEDLGVGGQRGFRQFYNGPVKNAQAVETTYQLADQVYKEYQDAKARGNDLPTGAQSMLLLSDHMGTTFGMQKGVHQTQRMIAEHMGARSISDDMEVTINKLINGDMLSEDQWKAFHALIEDTRNQTWQRVKESGDSEEIPDRYLPYPQDVRRQYRMGPGRMDEIQMQRDQAAAGGAPAPAAAPPARPTRPAPAAAGGGGGAAAGPTAQQLTQMGVTAQQWAKRPAGATVTVPSKSNPKLRYWTNDQHQNLGAVS